MPRGSPVSHRRVRLVFALNHELWFLSTGLDEPMAPRYTAKELEAFRDFAENKHRQGFDVDALETYEVLGSKAKKPRRSKTPARDAVPRRPPPSAVRSKPAAKAAAAQTASFARGTSPERREPPAPRGPPPSATGGTNPPLKAAPPPTAKTLPSALETSFNPTRDIKKIARDSGVPKHRVSTLVHDVGVLKAQTAALGMRREGDKAQECHIALTASATKKGGRGARAREDCSGGKDEPPIMFLRTSVSPVKRRNAEASSSKRTLDDDDRDMPTSKRRRTEDEQSDADGGEELDELDELEETDEEAHVIVCKALRARQRRL
ncbi:hypothetical protein C8J57DRAFT_1530232 [Mycena rebaudengoi]|nr:hypothetical protein C8J57DRAFT_1530232 [Mycena rebaudengoi]